MSAAVRRVRVTVEGEAREVSGRCGVLRIDLAADASGLVPTVMVNPAWSGVSVEDVAPSYNWRDGDVVQHDPEGWTLTRDRGRWASSRNPAAVWTDGMVSQSILPANGWGRFVLLRYQGGEA